MKLSDFKTTGEFLAAVARAGGKASGTPVAQDFAAGWALHPFKGEVAHHWRVGRSAAGAVGVYSACGLRTCVTDQVQLLGPGNYPLCERCDVKLLRKARI